MPRVSCTCESSRMTSANTFSGSSANRSDPYRRLFAITVSIVCPFEVLSICACWNRLPRSYCSSVGQTRRQRASQLVFNILKQKREQMSILISRTKTKRILRRQPTNIPDLELGIHQAWFKAIILYLYPAQYTTIVQRVVSFESNSKQKKTIKFQSSIYLFHKYILSSCVSQILSRYSSVLYKILY